MCAQDYPPQFSFIARGNNARRAAVALLNRKNYGAGGRECARHPPYWKDYVTLTYIFFNTVLWPGCKTSKPTHIKLKFLIVTLTFFLMCSDTVTCQKITETTNDNNVIKLTHMPSCIRLHHSFLGHFVQDSFIKYCYDRFMANLLKIPQHFMKWNI